MAYLRIDGIEYPANFTGKMNDSTWDNRATKTINTAAFDVQTALTIFHDDLEWAIVNKSYEQEVDEEGNPMYDDDGNPIMKENEVVYNNSNYSILGDITIHSDGSLSIVMGTLTDLEQAYEILYGGE